VGHLQRQKGKNKGVRHHSGGEPHLASKCLDTEKLTCMVLRDDSVEEHTREITIENENILALVVEGTSLEDTPGGVLGTIRRLMNACRKDKKVTQH